ATPDLYPLSLHDALPILNDVAAQRNNARLIRPVDLPGRAVAQPVVGSLLLRPILDLLFEEPEFVVDPVTVSRHPQGCEGIEKARSEEHTSELQSPCNLVC